MNNKDYISSDICSQSRDTDLLQTVVHTVLQLKYHSPELTSLYTVLSAIKTLINHIERYFFPQLCCQPQYIYELPLNPMMRPSVFLDGRSILSIQW